MAVKNNHTKLKAGLGLATIAAAAASYYFFGKDGKAHRKSAKVWADKAKTEVVAEVKKLKKLTPADYTKAVNKVQAKYKKFQNAYPKEFAVLSNELKKAGSEIVKRFSVSKTKVVTKAKSKPKTNSKRAKK